jgi:hypothetical protein
MEFVMEWLLVAVGVLLVVGVYLSWTAGRLDRTHSRVDASRAVLDAELLRRSSTVLDIAASGLLDPATSVLWADAASRAASAGESARDQAESDLTTVLAAALDDPDDVDVLRKDRRVDAALGELAVACRRAGHARRFHNDLVRSAQRLRRKLVVRVFGLAGHAPWPETAELDDRVPHGLAA